MRIYANGCSWTWGGGIFAPSFSDDLERLKVVWPHHVGETLNCDSVVNLSEGCGSNERILRTTFDWLSTTDKNTLKDTIAIIQWTDPSRYEFYDTINQKDIYENNQYRWTSCKTDVVLFRRRWIDPEFHKYHVDLTNRYLSTFADIQGAYKLLFHVEAIASLFKEYNIRLINWSNGTRVEKLPDHIRTHLQKYEWIPNYLDWEYERLIDDPHPSLNGHKQIAKYISDYIKENS